MRLGVSIVSYPSSARCFNLYYKQKRGQIGIITERSSFFYTAF